MSDPDREAFEFYEDPANREPAPGPARRRAGRQRPTLSEYLPIRLDAEAMAGLRERAHREGVSVSGYVRRLIERDLAESDQEPAAAVDAAIQQLQQLRRSLSRS